MDRSYLHHRKLLLVDDEPGLLKMVTSILTDDGFENIVTADSEETGIAAVQRENPDLLIAYIITLCHRDIEEYYMWVDSLFFKLLLGYKKKTDKPKDSLSDKSDNTPPKGAT